MCLRVLRRTLIPSRQLWRRWRRQAIDCATDGWGQQRSDCPGSGATLIAMPDEPEHASASDAISSDILRSATPVPEYLPIPALAATDNGDASGATLTALADDLEYTLTVGQALERFVAAKRAAPSGRSIQRYCIERRLASQKIRTVFGSEWLINESSLARLIESEPVVTGDASVAVGTAMAATATLIPSPANIREDDTVDGGVVSVATRATMATPEGERRTIAEVLIENARLLAQVEGRDSIIIELKEDRTFLREEVREGRRTRDDVKNIAERMLDTLKTMATMPALMKNSPRPDPLHATIIDPENRWDGDRG